MNIAYAMGQGGGPGADGGAGFLSTPLLPIILMLAIMWFLLIRPQQKKQKEHRELLSNLKKGDMIITSGGLYGRITGVTEAVLTVEIADKVRVKVSRGHISGLAQATKPSTPPDKEKTETESK
jgi:preprotein translocase subunit YajC